MEAWKYADGLTQDELTGGDYVGFVYIFEFEDGTWYIGSKQMYKRVKEAKKLKATSEENNWRLYSSSSSIVNAKIAEGIAYIRTVLWPFNSMKETLFVEAALIYSCGLKVGCLNLAVISKTRLPTKVDDRKRLLGVIGEIQSWL